MKHVKKITVAKALWNITQLQADITAFVNAVQNLLTGLKANIMRDLFS